MSTPWRKGGKVVRIAGQVMRCSICPCCLLFQDTYALTDYVRSSELVQDRFDPGALPVVLTALSSSPNSCSTQRWESSVAVDVQRRTRPNTSTPWGSWYSLSTIATGAIFLNWGMSLHGWNADINGASLGTVVKDADRYSGTPPGGYTGGIGDTLTIA